MATASVLRARDRFCTPCPGSTRMTSPSRARHHGSQVGVPPGQRGPSLLQQPQMLLARRHDAEEAQRPGAQRGRGQAFGVAQGAGERGGLLEVGVGQRGVAGPVLRLRQSHERVAARHLVVGDELFGHLEAAGEVTLGLLEGEQVQRAFSGREAVADGLVRVGQRGAHVEVVGQLVDVGVEFVGVRPLGGDRDLVVVAHPPTAQELAVDRVAHERVVEDVAVADVVSDAAEQAGLLGPVEGIEPAVGSELGGLGHDARLALGAGHGGRLQQVDHVLGQPRDAPGHQLADRFGRAQPDRSDPRAGGPAVPRLAAGGRDLPAAGRRRRRPGV